MLALLHSRLRKNPSRAICLEFSTTHLNSVGPVTLHGFLNFRELVHRCLLRVENASDMYQVLTSHNVLSVANCFANSTLMFCVKFKHLREREILVR